MIRRSNVPVILRLYLYLGTNYAGHRGAGRIRATDHLFFRVETDLRVLCPPPNFKPTGTYFLVMLECVERRTSSDLSPLSSRVRRLIHGGVFFFLEQRLLFAPSRAQSLSFLLSSSRPLPHSPGFSDDEDHSGTFLSRAGGMDRIVTRRPLVLQLNFHPTQGVFSFYLQSMYV